MKRTYKTSKRLATALYNERKSESVNDEVGPAFIFEVAYDVLCEYPKFFMDLYATKSKPRAASRSVLRSSSDKSDSKSNEDTKAEDIKDETMVARSVGRRKSKALE